MEFVSFEIAKKLKEKGFPQHWSDQHYILENEYEDDFFEVGSKYPVEIIYDYILTIAAPTISQVLKWLRDEKKIHIGVLYHNYYAVWIQPMKRNESEHVIHDCKTHEGAALAGIEYVLNNLI